jgi:amidase
LYYICSKFRNMTFQEYRRYDAIGLAELIKKHQVTSTELLQLAIARAEEVNPSINAIIHKIYDQAATAAQQADPDSPFAGVPYLLKDLGQDMEGVPKRTGSKGYQNYVSPHDSYTVTKIRAAGLVIFGKTNAPEFGLTPYTEPRLFGPTRNPWNTAYTSGGSSGGSSAAVAAGIVPMASANDGGGSIRIPASCCGLFGMKPSRGLVALGPDYGEMWSGAVTEGCVSRTVRDSAAYLDAVIGNAPGSPYVIQQPARPFLQEVVQSPGRLKIGFSATHTMGQSVDPACIYAMQNTIAALRDEGHLVEEVALPYQREDLTSAFLVMVAAEAHGEVYRLSRFLGRKVRSSDIEPNSYALYLLGQAFSAGEYAIAKQRWNQISQRCATFHAQYDVLLTPTLAAPPLAVGQLHSAAEERLVRFINNLGLGSLVKSQIGPLADKIYGWMPWTAFANITGQPSMSLPAHYTDNNLPIGVMLTAAIGRDDLLFRLAGQLEEAMPWRRLEQD